MPRQTPQVDPVHHAVQYVDQLRGGHGQSQGHDIAGDALWKNYGLPFTISRLLWPRFSALRLSGVLILPCRTPVPLATWSIPPQIPAPAPLLFNSCIL